MNLSPNIAAAGTAMSAIFFSLAFTGRCTPRVPEARKKSQKNTLQVSWIAWVLIFVRHSLTKARDQGISCLIVFQKWWDPIYLRQLNDELLPRLCGYDPQSLAPWQFFSCSQLSPPKRSLEMACIEMENRHVLRWLGRPCLGSLFRHIPLRLSYAFVLYTYGWFTCILYMCRILNDASRDQFPLNFTDSQQ